MSAMCFFALAIYALYALSPPQPPNSQPTDLGQRLGYTQVADILPAFVPTKSDKGNKRLIFIGDVHGMYQERVSSSPPHTWHR